MLDAFHAANSAGHTNLADVIRRFTPHEVGLYYKQTNERTLLADNYFILAGYQYRRSAWAHCCQKINKSTKCQCYDTIRYDTVYLACRVQSESDGWPA